MSDLICSQESITSRTFKQPGDSSLSGADRHDVAVSQGFDIAHRRLAEESAGSGSIPKVP